MLCQSKKKNFGEVLNARLTFDQTPPPMPSSKSFFNQQLTPVYIRIDCTVVENGKCLKGKFVLYLVEF